MRIRRLDQSVFSGARPALDLFLPRDCGFDIGCCFEVDQCVDTVSFRKSFCQTIFVLIESSFQIVGDSCIEHVVVTIGQQKNVIGAQF